MRKKPNRLRVQPDAESQGENLARNERSSDVHGDAMRKARSLCLPTIINPRRVRIARSGGLLPPPPRASVLQHNSVNRCFLDKRTECEPGHICGLGPRLSVLPLCRTGSAGWE